MPIIAALTSFTISSHSAPSWIARSLTVAIISSPYVAQNFAMTSVMVATVASICIITLLITATAVLNVVCTCAMMRSPFSCHHPTTAVVMLCTTLAIPCMAVMTNALAVSNASLIWIAMPGYCVVIVSYTFAPAATTANSAATNAPVVAITPAIGAITEPNAATSATPTTATSPAMIGIRLSWTILMNGCIAATIAVPWPANCSRPGTSLNTSSKSCASGSSAAMMLFATPSNRSLSGSSASENLSKMSAGTSPSEPRITPRSASAVSPSCSMLVPVSVSCDMICGPRSSHCVPNNCTPAAFRSTSLSIPASAGTMILNASAVVFDPSIRPWWRSTISLADRSVK